MRQALEFCRAGPVDRADISHSLIDAQQIIFSISNLLHSRGTGWFVLSGSSLDGALKSFRAKVQKSFSEVLLGLSEGAH